MPDCTAVPQPILPCEAGAGATYISGACPHVGHVLNGSLVKKFSASNYVTVPNEPGLQTTGPISVSMWIKPDTLPAEGTRTAIFGHYTHSPTKGFVVWVEGQKVGFGGRRTSGGGGYYAVTTANSLLTLGGWSHIAAVYTPGATNNIYVDGVDQTLGPPPSWPSAPATLSVGIDNPNIVGSIGEGNAFHSAANRFFDGSISNVAYYVKALSAAEALAEYQAGCPATLTGTTGSLCGYWPLEGNLTDISAGLLDIGGGVQQGSVPDEIDITRPVTQIKQEDLDISAVSATTALYYTIWQDPVLGDTHNYGARLGEITLHYTVAGGGGGGGGANTNLIVAGDTLVSNVAFSTVSGNAVIIDSRNKFDVRILSMNSAFNCTLRKDTSGGDIVSYVPAGNTKLRASIPVADGTNVYLDGDSNTTLTYCWTHGPTI